MRLFCLDLRGSHNGKGNARLENEEEEKEEVKGAGRRGKGITKGRELVTR